MSNCTKLEKALAEAFKDEDDRARILVGFVAEVWRLNIQKEYAAEAVEAVDQLIFDYPTLGPRGVKFVETPKESDPVRMIRITEQNFKHYQTAALVCNHIYAADITQEQIAAQVQRQWNAS